MAPLLKLMEAYCARTGLQMDQVSVEFDGNRLLGNRTPEPLQMEDKCLRVYLRGCSGHVFLNGRVGQNSRT